ncbi:peptidoglycan-binding domain-containing protein [Streptomyces mangrovisoli]|uniref:Peptidoglycan binding-like domain-containing protein n=1 Tax=Streptomyces mangrovisoli TaxID=1428628 RepID=A0A1J4NME3_9ACTN|nr:peptidoglycan-binding domain-containing protein [Streptomyces mangrovisoli]OIJ63577.1 hypothetical protein WN71_032635 [Streptomyces mangrovisoli]
MWGKFCRVAVAALLLTAATESAYAAEAGPAAALPRCSQAKSYHQATVPASPFGVDCLLTVGSQGPGVVALQRSLRRCYGSTIADDGIFGRRTQDALRYAQRQAGTEPDGVYGPNTRRAIKHHPDQWHIRCKRVP